MRAVIIDDEANSRELLANMLSIYCPDAAVTAVADSVQTGYTAILSHSPDVVF